jgi:hypothetical protein
MIGDPGRPGRVRPVGVAILREEPLETGVLGTGALVLSLPLMHLLLLGFQLEVLVFQLEVPCLERAPHFVQVRLQTLDFLHQLFHVGVIHTLRYIAEPRVVFCHPTLRDMVNQRFVNPRRPA